jgi:hypothetical protein
MSRDNAEPTPAEKAELTPAEIRAAEAILERALIWRALPDYSPEERWALAILVADQKARGKKSKSPAKRQAEYRRNRVNLLLRYVVDKKYRGDEKTARSLKTVMIILDWLDTTGIEASETQVRRDIEDALKRGPLPTE